MWGSGRGRQTAQPACYAGNCSSWGPGPGEGGPGVTTCRSGWHGQKCPLLCFARARAYTPTAIFPVVITDTGSLRLPFLTPYVCKPNLALTKKPHSFFSPFERRWPVSVYFITTNETEMQENTHGFCLRFILLVFWDFCFRFHRILIALQPGPGL